MNVDELRQEIKTDIKSIEDKIGEIATDVATIAAKLDGTHDRASTEIGVLFDRHNELSARVQRIEVSYVPREAHEKHVATNDGEHRDFRIALQSHAVSLAKLTMYAAAVGGGIGVSASMIRGLF